MEVPKASQSSPSAIVAILTHDLAAWRAKYSSFIEQGKYRRSNLLVLCESNNGQEGLESDSTFIIGSRSFVSAHMPYAISRMLVITMSDIA